MGTNPVESSGGSFQSQVIESQTGDAEKKLQEVPLPDDDGYHSVIARVAAQANDGSEEYAAYKRFEKIFRKKNGSLVPSDTIDRSPSNDFDVKIGLFEKSNFKLQDAGNGNAELAVVSPSEVNGTSINATLDLSTLTGVPTDKLLAGCDTSPQDGSLHYLFDDSLAAQVSYYSPSVGTKEQVANQRVDGTRTSVEVSVDSNGDVHAAWFKSSDQSVQYAVRSSGSWSAPEEVDNTGPMTSISMDLDENNTPHLSYKNANTNSLRYANRVGGSWSNEEIKANGVSANDIFVNNSKDIGISFRNFSDGSLGFASGEAGNFSVDLTAYPLEEPVGTSVGGKKNNGNWSISHVSISDNNLRVTTGTVGSGFQTSEVLNRVKNHEEGNLHIVGPDFSIVAAQDRGSSNAEIYTNKTGSWSFEKTIEEFGADFCGARNIEYITLTDNASGNSLLSSISLIKSVSADIEWRSKYLR